MAELYAKPKEDTAKTFALGQDIAPEVQSPEFEEITGNKEVDAYLASLPADERLSAYKRLTAPLTGEELINKVHASSYEYVPTIDEFDRIYQRNKEQETFTLEGAGAIADGIGSVLGEVADTIGSSFDGKFDSRKILPTIIEAGARGTHRTVGMFSQSENPDGILFGFKDILTGGGTRESRYNQYLEALKYKREEEKLRKGETHIVFDKNLTNHKWVETGSLVLDPMLLAGGLGKALGVTTLAGKAMQATGLAYAGAVIGETANAIKFGVLGGSLKLSGAGLEFLGGAVRNTVDFGIEKAGAGLEGLTGLSAKEFNVGLKSAGIGTTVADIAGHGVPYGSGISEVYLGSGAARSIGEAMSATGGTMLRRMKYGRGINSWAAETMATTTNLSKEANAILNVVNAVDPMFTYTSAVMGGATHGAVFGGVLGYLDNKTEGLYAGIGAGIALGGLGGLAGKAIGDVSGGTGRLRREIQAHMVMEGLKEIDPIKHQALDALRVATKAKGFDSDFVNSVIVGLDKFAPDISITALTEAQFKIYAEKAGYNPKTAQFTEHSTLQGNLSLLNDMTREGRANALSILRDNGFEYAGDRAGFLEALKTRDSYKDIARRWNKLSDFHKEALLKQIDTVHPEMINANTFTKTEIRQHYNNIQWAERITDIINDYHGEGVDPMGVKKAKETIQRLFKEETGSDGKLSTRGELLKDKLRTDGYLDKNGTLLDVRDSHNFELNERQFRAGAGIVIEKGRDGKTNMFLNLNNMQNDTFAHELFHTAMRTSIHAREFIDRFTSALHGKYDKAGNLISKPEVSEAETLKFLERYINARFGNKGVLSEGYVKDLESIKTALLENKKGVRNNIDAWKVLEHYSEEFGAYYFSEWIKGRNRNFLFKGGNLTGIEGLMERAKDGWLYYWQEKFSDANPTLNFEEGKGIATAFERSGSLGRIRTIDMMMRDFVRATSASNSSKAFNPTMLSEGALTSLVENSGVRGVASINPKTGKIEVLDAATAKAENIKAGKAAYNILNTLDPKLRTSVTDGDGNITGRLSKNEFDALVRAGIVNQAWVDKHLQLYNIIDGKESNTVQFGYLGKTEQVTDASQPRNRGKDVTFKQRQAIVLDVTTKIGKDGKFYTVFDTLDKKVISVRQNNLWSNPECRSLWDNNRTLMEADFFKYLENASKSANDPSRLQSAIILDKGDGLGGKRRDYLHQMLGMAKTDIEPYNNKPLAEIPQGIRHSVTSFNVDGVVGTLRIDNSQRVNYNHKNAFRDLSHNWSPADSSVEKTPAGDILTHPSGYKFIENKDGTYKAFDNFGNLIGTFKNKQEAFTKGGVNYNSVYSDQNISKLNSEFRQGQDRLSKHFEPALTDEEKRIAKETGSVFNVPRIQSFVDGTKVIKQTRDEFVVQKLEELLADGNELAFDKAIQEAVAHFQPIKMHHDALQKSVDDIGKQIIALREERDTKVQEALVHAMYADAGDQVYVQAQQIRDSYNAQMKKLEVVESQLVKQASDAGSAFSYNGKNLLDLIEKRIPPKTAERPPVFKEWHPDGSEKVFDTEAPALGLGNMSLRDWAKICLKSYKDEINSTWGSQIHYEKAEYIRPIFDIVSHLYDKQFNTGEPFSVMATHGTKSVNLATEMVFDVGQLGTNFSLESSRAGAWFAGSQETATTGAYALSKLAKSKSQLGARDEVKLSVRGLIKMENPLVIEWNNGYRESKLYRIIDEAKQKGHDGIVFKRIIDGGLMEDNHYIILNNSHKVDFVLSHRDFSGNIPNNILLLDSTVKPALDEKGHRTYDQGHNTQVERASEALPRGTDERGNPIKTGKDLGLYYSPAEEGGREYTSEQFKYEFIGKQAEKNPSKLYGINLTFSENKQTVKGQNNVTLTLNEYNQGGNQVGIIMAKIYDDGTAKIVDTNVNPNFQNQGYGTILYSELAERFRHMGVKEIVGEITNEDGVPQKIREKVIGNHRTDYDTPSNISESGYATVSKLDKNKHYQPYEESGNVYSDKDFFGEFIGKVAQGKKALISGLKLQFKDETIRRNEGFPDADYNDLTITTSDNRAVGSISGRISKDGKRITDVEASISYDQRGKGLGKILYSEFLERMRNKGVQIVHGNVTNSEGIPVKIRNQVAGKGNTTLLDEPRYKGEGALPSTNKNFRELRQANLDEGKPSGVPVYTELEKNAWYSPAEKEKFEQEKMSLWEQEMLKAMQASLNKKHPDLDKTKLQSIIKSEEFIGTQIHNVPDSQKKMQNYYVISKGFDTDRVVLLIRERKTDKKIADITANKRGDLLEDVGSWVNLNERKKGWGTVLYSELFQRANLAGVKQISGGVINEKGHPIAIRNKIGGRGSTFIMDDATQEYIPATVKDYLKQKEKVWSVDTYTNLDPNAWYSFRNEIPDNPTWKEGIAKGWIKFVDNFNSLGASGAMMIAHMPDTAKVGEAKAGQYKLADMQGGLLYTVVNDNKVWASNFGNEEGGALKKFVDQHLAKSLEENKNNPEFKKQYPNGVAYILLTKSDSPKLFAAVDGTKGLVNAIDVFAKEGVISEVKAKEILLKNASEYADVSGLRNKSLDEVVAGVNALINNQGKDIGTFPNRSTFAAGVVSDFSQIGGKKKRGDIAGIKPIWYRNKKLVSKLEGLIGERIKGTLNKGNAGEIIARMFEEEYLKDVPEGHSYGVIKITAPLKETADSGHRGYTGSLEQTSGRHELILFNETHNVTELVNKGHKGFNEKQGRDMFGEPIKISDPTISKPLKDAQGKQLYEMDEKGNFVMKDGKKVKQREIIYQGEGAYGSYTGSNIPFQQVVAKSAPVLSKHNWVTEKTPNGEIIKSDLGYRITETKSGAYKVWDKGNIPTKGLYSTLAQAKLNVDKLELTKR